MKCERTGNHQTLLWKPCMERFHPGFCWVWFRDLYTTSKKGNQSKQVETFAKSHFGDCFVYITYTLCFYWPCCANWRLLSLKRTAKALIRLQFSKESKLQVQPVPFGEGTAILCPTALTSILIKHPHSGIQEQVEHKWLYRDVARVPSCSFPISSLFLSFWLYSCVNHFVQSILAQSLPTTDAYHSQWFGSSRPPLIHCLQWCFQVWGDIQLPKMGWHVAVSKLMTLLTLTSSACMPQSGWI